MPTGTTSSHPVPLSSQVTLVVIRHPTMEGRFMRKLAVRAHRLSTAGSALEPMTISHHPGGSSILHLPAPRAALGHAVPVVFEGVIAPIAVFYLALIVAGLHGALIAALSWSFAAVIRRIRRGERISTVLMLDLILLSIRTTVAYLTGSALLYFIQPMAWSLLIALVLIGSAIARKPFTQRFAQDFCPLDPAVLARPRVQRFFVQVSLLWAGVLIANTAIVLWLLLSSSLATFVLERTGVAWTLTAIAVVCSIRGFTNTMRRDGVTVQWGGVRAMSA